MSQPRGSSGSPWVLGAVACAVAWWAFDLLLLRAGTPDRFDTTWEYGVAARALLEGHGFRTLVIHSPLGTLRDAAGTVPVLTHGPLLPLLLAPFLALFGPRSLDAIAWLAAAGAVAVVPPLIRLGERCGHAAIGAGAALVWTLAPLTLHSVHHDAALPIAAALLVAALDLFTRREPRPFAGGVALGLAGLARPEMLGALPIAALAAGAPGVGWLLLGALLPLLLWWIHDALAAGLPLVAWLPQSLPPGMASAPHALARALLAPTGALGWLAAIGAVFGIAARATRRVALLVVGIALVPIVVLSVTGDERTLVPFLPLYALGAARGLDGICGTLPAWARRPRFTIGLLLLVLVPVTGPATREEAVHAREARASLVEERSRLAAWSVGLRSADPTAASLLFSDTPGLVAWTIRRPTMGLTPQETRLLPATATAGRPARPDSLHTWFHDPP